MKHSTTLLTPAHCLLRALCPTPQLPIVHQFTDRLARANFSSHQRKYAQGFMVSPRNVAGIDSESRLKPIARDPLSKWTKDETIDAPDGVQVVQADGKLGPPQHLRGVLMTLNRKEEHVVQVALPTKDRPTVVVKILAKSDMMRQRMEKQDAVKQQRKSIKELAPKQIELNWAIGPHDLGIKLGQLEKFVEKGKTVEIILAPKKRQRRATAEEGNEVLRNIRDRLFHIGGKEIKPMEGQVPRQAILTVKKKEAD